MNTPIYCCQQSRAKFLSFWVLIWETGIEPEDLKFKAGALFGGLTVKRHCTLATTAGAKEGLSLVQQAVLE
jgi:hypothetical protein